MDTSYVVALASDDDRHHVQALKMSYQMEADDRRVWTTRAIILEVGNALSRRAYRRTAIALINAFESSDRMKIVTLDDSIYRDAWKLYSKYVDKEWGLVDCISNVVMTTHGLTEVLTADKHFEQMGFNILLK